MLLLLVLGMLEALVVLVGRIFERVKFPTFFWGENIELKKKLFSDEKKPKTKSKSIRTALFPL